MNYTFAEYLDLEHQSDTPHEFHAGEIFAMSGGTEVHSRLSARMAVLLDRLFPMCRVYDSKLKLYVETWNRGLYPDAMLLCGEPIFWNDQTDVILNPTLVVEVLSSSRHTYDRGPKSEFYRAVPSIKHILLISQWAASVEYFERHDNGWTITPHVGSETISVLGSQLQLADIYAGILS